MWQISRVMLVKVNQVGEGESGCIVFHVPQCTIRIVSVHGLFRTHLWVSCYLNTLVAPVLTMKPHYTTDTILNQLDFQLYTTPPCYTRLSKQITIQKA
jgi:hypothetical protein